MTAKHPERITCCRCASKPLLAIALVWLSVRPGVAQVIHLHDSDSEQLAREALTTLGKLEAPETSMFQGMLRNLDAAHQRSLAVLWERGQAKLASRVDKIVEWNWNTLSEQVADSENEFIAAYKKAMLLHEESSLGLENLAAKIQSAEAQLKAAKEQLAHHDAGEKEMGLALEHYVSALGEIQKIAADRELEKKLKNLQLDKTQGYLKKLQALAKNADTKAGLRPLYLDLGLSLAVLEIEALKAELKYHRWTLAAADERLGRLKRILGCTGSDQASEPAPAKGADSCDDAGAGVERGDFGRILQASRPPEDHHGQNAFGAAGDELIMITLGRLAKNAHQEGLNPSATGGGGEFEKQFPHSVALRELLDNLASFASIVGYQKFLLEADENEDNFRSRRESIVITQIEDSKLDILLAHALQGLLAYQGGGLRPMDILNMAGGLRP